MLLKSLNIIILFLLLVNGCKSPSNYYLTGDNIKDIYGSYHGNTEVLIKLEETGETCRVTDIIDENGQPKIIVKKMHCFY